MAKGLNQAVSRKSVITEERIQAFWDLNHMEGTRDATIMRFSQDGSGVRDHLREIRVPTLILWGQQDWAMSVSAAYQHDAVIRDSRLIIYPNTGHLLQEEVADESAAEVRSFLLGRSEARQ